MTYSVVTPYWYNWFTASTYGPNFVEANTVFNDWNYQNSPGTPGYGTVSGPYWVDGTHIRFVVTIHNVAAGKQYTAVTRQNDTGALRFDNYVYVSNPNGNYTLNTLYY